MESTWLLAALWLGLALLATLIAIWLRVSTALSEIVVGTVAQLIIGAAFGGTALGATVPWIAFLSGTGSIVLTFLAGAELDPVTFKTKWKETSAIGIVGFIGPFLGCAAVAHYAFGWSPRASWLAGVALSTTSVAVVYAVMLELGLNRTEFGKTVLGACFVNDLATVIVLGLIFSPFTLRTLIFVGVSVVVFAVLPWLTPRFFRRYGDRPSELEAKYLLLLLFGMGGLAVWAGSEAVLPAYMIGMVLAGTVGKDHILVRRLRTLTFGLLTPFYFIRAGSFVSVPALVGAPLVFFGLLAAKMVSKLAGLYPTIKAFRYPTTERTYFTLLMSTGLTFGTISALFGLSHNVIDQAQYSFPVAAVIHANPWALDAVLRDAGSVDHALFLGDAVNYGPDPRSVIAALRRLDVVGVRGNHDHAVAYGADPRASAAKQAFALAMRDWTRARLDVSELTWLNRLPLQTMWKCGGTRIAMCHATPHDPMFDYRFVPAIPDTLVAEIVSGVNADVLLVGHTHMPFSRLLGTMTIVNPGSVGQPLDGDPRAAYALWDDGETRLRRAEYDIEAAAHALRTAAIPNEGRVALMESLRSGRLI